MSVTRRVIDMLYMLIIALMMPPSLLIPDAAAFDAVAAAICFRLLF